LKGGVLKMKNIMSSLQKNKRGMTLGDMYPAVLTIVMIGIILGIGLYVLTEVNDQIDDADASSAINDTVQGLGDFAGWIAVIVVVIAAAIVLGIVLRSFGGGSRGV
jgi:type II secretory pathway component PulF